VLVYEFGPQQACRSWRGRGHGQSLPHHGVVAGVDWRACGAYAVTGAPAAALGARTLLILPPRIVDVAIGVFLIAMIPARRWLVAHEIKLGLWHLAVIGAVRGFITGIWSRPGRSRCRSS